MRKYGVAVLVLFTLLMNAQAQNDPLSTYLFNQNWTPVPQQESYWVPGIILTVDLSSGQIGHLDPLLTDTQRALVLNDESGMFDEHRSAFTTDGAGAVSGIKQLLNGLDIGASFKSAPSVSFSGMSFTGQMLEDSTPLTNRTTSVYQNLVQRYGEVRRVGRFGHGPRYAFFLVQTVALGTSAHIVTTSATAGNLSIGGAQDAGSCSAPQLPPSLTKTTTETEANAPENAQASGTNKTDALADAAKKKAADETPKTAGDAEQKQSQAAHAAPSAKFSFCHAGTNELTFASSQPLPVAMKLRLIGSYQNKNGEQTRIDIDSTDTPLPIGVSPGKVKCAAQDALHRKFPKFAYAPCIP